MPIVDEESIVWEVGVRAAGTILRRAPHSHKNVLATVVWFSLQEGVNDWSKTADAWVYEEGR
jgi:hypothetical protein